MNASVPLAGHLGFDLGAGGQELFGGQPEGQAPFDVWKRAVGSGAFTPLSATGSLRVLRRI